MNTCPDCKNDLVCHDQGECLRPTPETDAAFEEFRETCDLSNLENEMAAMERQRNEARELLASEKSTRNTIIKKGIETERQLAEAREAFVIATDQLVQVQSELRQAREGVARLQMELETLKQAASVRINVEHTELRQARDENAKLREALEKSKEFVQSWGELIDTQYPLWNECMTTIQKALTP